MRCEERIRRIPLFSVRKNTATNKRITADLTEALHYIGEAALIVAKDF